MFGNLAIGFLLVIRYNQKGFPFEKHVGAESKNQNGNILLINDKLLYDLFHELRNWPPCAEEFWATAGVLMTVPATEASSAPQGQQAGAPASWEPNGVQVDGVTVDPPLPGRGAMVMLTEEEKASLCLLGLKQSSSTAELDTICGIEGPAAEQIKDEAGGDHVMHDALVGVTETEYQLDSDLRDVRGLLSTGLLEGFRVTYMKDEVEEVGRINGQGYSCGCSKCNYNSNIMNACEFEEHYGQSFDNQIDHIFLDTGISLFRVVEALKPCKLNMLGDFIEEKIGFPPNLDEYNKWKASFQKRKDYLDAVASDGCLTQSSQGLAAGEMIYSLRDYLKDSVSNSISNLNWSASKRRSGRRFRQGDTGTSTPTFSGSPGKGGFGHSTDTSEKKGTEETHRLSLSSPVKITQRPLRNCSIDSKSKESKTRDTTLHPLIFKEDGLADNTLLTYKLKNGEALKQGYKRGTCIICNCCNQEFSPSHFEEHAGMGRRRQPYHNIYTLEGLSLHKLALQLQDHLNPNGFDNASVSSVSDYHNLTSSGCGREPSTTSGPIVPLKRTLQERVVETESCYFCGYGHTTIGNINPDTIIFCNQCERPCHIKCYNNRVVKKKVPLEILKEYMCFHFLCCQECQSLRARLEEGLEKCVGITFLRRIRSNICWRLLSGMDASRDVKLYMPQVIDIFKDAFMDSTDEHSDIISDMVNGKNGDQEKDFRGMYCALLTASTHVVSAAILKVRIEQIAELVLIATRSECRKKGYFILLLKSIEANLRAWNVSLLTAPVDPEMAQIWSEKLGFTILSAEEKESMLESHPLVMFKNLVLVQKSLA
ncbi:uncharacterized protein [Zea mays]|uniref:Acyl-CoA N-acyltransferase with RING/FYVE/PHD-type zinc finger domain n=1 Tax=Zea mays TaxID=4577 RepID=A0A1D6JYC8_MAIZE|nr:uncharacterized protein LOC100279211 [Zea mays]XP_035821942.1 uncharacterized protein LOC100279211 isoform X4 [Zea mays]ONL96672.1 Acyl-CoA N-acyltransferase with RING/FYVE/PHD-type zinc finger domain [Zea mays]|eukprot:XP_020405427.1 uncharacterized protein LOC100279211 isoform X4 [Zea mays]